MSNGASIVDPFHRAVYDVLANNIDKRMVSLAEGSCGDFASYKYQTGYIQALNDVLAKCKELELERYGNRPGEGEQQQG